MKNICHSCQKYLEILSGKMNFSDAELNLLKKPARTLVFDVAIKMDSGVQQTFKGYRVQYNDALGPTKGGLRFHSSVNLQEIMFLAFLMALKCSLVGLPLGGAKGGIAVDPRALSQAELERLSRKYIRQVYQFIGPDKDIPAPDLNTDEQIMAWMVDEYSKIKGEFTPAVITGKPINLGGSEGRTIATSLGGAYVLKRLLELKKIDAKKLTVAIQGFGNVGANLAKILDEWGYKIISVSNSREGIYDSNGLDIKYIINHHIKHGSFDQIKNVKHVSNQKLLELDCDILIPAAIENQITDANAEKIKAKIILEMANGPTTPAADTILFEKGVTVIPDIIANAGGVIVSYFEWQQNLAGEHWTEKEVFDKLKKQITAALEELYRAVDKTKSDLRSTAQIMAIQKIIAAEKLRN